MRLNASAWYAIGSAVVLIAAGPVLIRLPDVLRSPVFLSFWWVIATQLVVANSARSASSTLAIDANGRLRADRAIRLIAHLVPFGALGHVLVSMSAFDENLGLAHFLPLLAIVPLRARDEAQTWVYAGFLMLIMSAQHQTLLPCAGLLVVVLIYKGYLLDRPRLSLGAVLCLHLVMGACGHTNVNHGFGMVEPWMLATSIGLLLCLAARYRMPLAAIAAGLLWYFGKPPGPTLTAVQWGGLLLVLGFGALVYALVRDVKRASRDLPVERPR
jgi:hypothetical protein